MYLIVGLGNPEAKYATTFLNMGFLAVGEAAEKLGVKFKKKECEASVAEAFIGGEKVVPNYNTMGLCKAALESATRYIAADVGPQGIRANTLSCGPIKTLAASGIKGFSSMLAQCKAVSPTRSLVSIDEVGNTAAFLLSDNSLGITAETIYIDGGFNALACCVDQTASENA